ncbi:hypothetical protein QYF61_020337 [Mycteria americana]|uniref:Sushi domain-containing protein n=1 Tax=Mycteria americana TaxID=33587 RepID=A0AAN7NU17_MYCAM|nr:hypothetical protein QYF61_020337 [Mycteria americana]
MHRSIPAVDHSSLAVYCFIPAVHLSIPVLEHHLSAAARVGGRELAAGVTAPVRCSRPKDVANAHIDAGNNTLLNARLRYTCNPGYKRKAGTSSLIQCVLHDGSSEPNWTRTTLQCIRKPSLGSRDAMGGGEGGDLHHQRGGGGYGVAPEVPTVPHTERTTQRGEEVANASHGGWFGATVIIVTAKPQPSWRRRQDYTVAVMAIPMVAPAAENAEVMLPGIFPTG